MNQTSRVFIRIAGVILILLLIIAISCFTLLDTKPYLQTEYYKKEVALVNEIQPGSQGNSSDTIEAGWSRVNLLPPFTTPIAIDAKRGGKHFEGVHDSIYVRAFVFKQGNKKIAYVSADLLIIPPTVTRLFDSVLVKQGFDANNIYFTATHTHTSIGGWHNSYVGEIFAGKYDARVPQHIADCISKAILQAEENCRPAKIGFGSYSTRHLVFNRLVHEKGRVDSLLRIVKIEQDNGAKAAIITFAAHCTVFHENLMSLSADWAGLMMTQLNQSGKIDFASYSAGAVGSQGPYEFTKNQEEEANYMAKGVGAIVLANFDSIETHYVSNMRLIHAPLNLREPNLRVTPQLVVRPWLFYKLFGNEKVCLNTLQLGDIIFAGTPCDFSGELTGPVDSVAKTQNLHLLITSFNGGYMGYVTDTKWYEMNTYETRTMGWFGPQNGDYMSEVLERLIGKAQPAKQ